MLKARMIVSKDFKIGQTDERLFGSFIEHMGSVVYNGIYEPDHPSADADGFRSDVLELIKPLDLSVIRYPGGNYSSGYRWEDGIGPRENRPAKLDLAWRAIEPNTFGLNEFMKWVRRVGADPILTVNLGTRGIEDACHMLEYCNFSGGGYWSNLRIAHGIREPYRVKIWCLGNELDGEWQIAGKTADEYGRLACETAKAMRRIDDRIELVAVGSSAPHMATYPEWDRTVLMHTYEHVDYLSLHHYIGKRGKDTAEYLAMPLGIEKQIGEMIAVCDYVKAAKRSKKTMHLSFDEWNVWREPDVEYVPWQTGSPYDWVKFHMEDALVFASAMLAILRNADRVRIACQSLLVNTIPLILTEKGGKAWRNPTYYPFLHVSKYGRGEVLRCVLDSPRYDTADYTDVPLIDTAVVWNEEKDELTVFAVNRGGEPVLLRMDIRDFGGLDFAEHIELRHDRLDAVNTADRPDEVAPRPGGGIAVRDGYAECLLGPWSWNVLRFSQDRKEERGHV